jgi:L-asparaginase II
MLSPSCYVPVFELTRGEIVESVHFGALAIVDAQGRLVASVGDPQVQTYLRSTAKPFQALPFVEAGGLEHFGLSDRQLAVMCASHTGMDEHVRVVASIQAAVGLRETDLLCGVHPPYHEPTALALRQRGEQPTPNRHNCSGKHSGMLAFARLLGYSGEYYIDPTHPVQQAILNAFAEMCAMEVQDVEVGIDGCSAPNFAAPLRNAAQGLARLCDPQGLPPARQAACRRITAAMQAHPEMVSGPDQFDTLLMQAAPGRLIAKGGAEGYQGIGLLPGALGPGSPGLGIAVKISDGDPRGRARHAVALEALRQLGALSAAELESLAQFGPIFPVHNWRNLLAGEGRPSFSLEASIRPASP